MLFFLWLLNNLLINLSECLCDFSKSSALNDLKKSDLALKGIFPYNMSQKSLSESHEHPKYSQEKTIGQFTFPD